MNANSITYPSRWMPIVGQSAFGVYQAALLAQLSWLALVVLVLALGRMVYGKEVLWFGSLGLGLALVLAHVLARMQLHSRWSALVLDDTTFVLVSVHAHLHVEQPRPFPLAYANARVVQDGLQLHYHDHVVTLYARDWPDWQAVVQRFLQAPQLV